VPTDTILAPAKLTLSLRVVGVRQDGYHLLSSEMVTVSYYDELKITSGESGLEVIGASNDVPIDSSNTVLQALKLTGERAHISLTKSIPSKAGLGGGSSDAAAVLRWAEFKDLEAASRIGADVPFCMIGGRALVSGIGEVVQPLEYVSKSFTLLTPPDLECSTSEVFKKWDELGGPKGQNGNDLEPAALAVEPELAKWKSYLADLSGLTPRLAGSGSTWFVEGQFEDPNCITCETVKIKI